MNNTKYNSIEDKIKTISFDELVRMKNYCEKEKKRLDGILQAEERSLNKSENQYNANPTALNQLRLDVSTLMAINQENSYKNILGNISTIEKMINSKIANGIFQKSISNQPTKRLKLSKKENDNLNNNIYRKVEKEKDNGETSLDKIYINLTNSSFKLFGHRLTIKQIQGRYERRDKQNK
jgi:hypothetical protein